MSNFLSKILVPTAVKKSNKFDLSCSHITTGEFFRPDPIYIKEIVPGEKVNIDVTSFSCLAALYKPIYGQVRMINYAHFVPMRTIMQHWNEFITDTPVANSTSGSSTKLIQSVPIIYNRTFQGFFTANSTAVNEGDSYDFYLPTDENLSNGTYRRFNQKGKDAYHLLQALGYQINLGTYNNTYSYSALPLLAFVRIFKDWFSNPQYLTNTIDYLFNKSDSEISQQDLYRLLDFALVANYNRDYFTSAWDNPVSPNNNTYSDVTINDPTMRGTTSTGNSTTVVTSKGLYETANEYHSPSLLGSSLNTSSNPQTYSPGSVTQYAHTALQRLTDFFKRNQLGGSRAWDRYFLKYGVKLPAANTNRSVYLGSQTMNIQVSDVMCTSPSDQTSQETHSATRLGDYTGKGIGYENGHFSLSSDEFGYLIITSIIVPKTSYVSGSKRFTWHNDRLSFFQGEFDTLGMQPIRVNELISGFNSKEEAQNFRNLNIDGVFGYTSRYAEYKNGFDFLTGDFARPLVADSMNNWHVSRLFDKENCTQSDIVHSETFCLGEKSQYDRIFQIDNTGNNYDHFFNVHQFKVTATLPMAHMYDDYEWSNDNDHSRKVEAEISGTML